MITDKKYILFDLDGTLTDPKEGICTCVQHALRQLGIEEPDLDKLEPFIGPPLKDSFMEFYGFSESQALEAIEVYRQRFSTVGKFENKVYSGIPELLRDLKSYGYHMAVASSKPECFVKEILEHFGIEEYFEAVVGSELDGSRTDKEEVIREALNRLFHYRAYKKAQIVMVGDRKFDIMGAKEIGVTSLGVSYGYGSEEELETAGAEYIADSVEALRALFIDEEALEQKVLEAKEAPVQSGAAGEKATAKGKGSVKEKGPSPILLVWKFLFPFLLFYFAGEFFRQAFGYVMMFFAEKSQAIYRFMIVAEDTSEEAWALSGNGSALIQMLTLAAVFVVLYRLAGGKETLQKAKEAGKRFGAGEWAVWLGLSIVLALGLNFLFVSIGWLGKDSGYQEAATNLYAVGIPAGVLLYGFFSPVTEELLFRGLIFNEVKTFMKPFGAALLSSALFGVYHGNLVQTAYSFAIGMVFAYAYHYSGQFAVPVVMHGVINVIVFLASACGLFRGDGLQLALGIVFLAGSAASAYLLIKNYGKRAASN